MMVETDLRQYMPHLRSLPARQFPRRLLWINGLGPGQIYDGIPADILPNARKRYMGRNMLEYKEACHAQ